MIRINRTLLSAVLGGVLATTAVVAAPLAAHAELTNPPACVESPYGGCQDGPLGNGGGGSWSTTGDVFSEFFAYSDGTIRYEGIWEFRRFDGAAPRAEDASRILSTSNTFTSCTVWDMSVTCFD
ncbi:hypothetical protein NVV95_00670 [Herbiconiux sp. CPCC 205716]|uniref:Secreted protein n=1 Tax=Herbiconiux gentiana TaxID=2970912 RepID=A0ABT2GDY7_9MICO|nr:hypothetical protein [Herbiconiux gentiana]MCS5713056.1 hypothetical protein [Herbiconiux gentiana]